MSRLSKIFTASFVAGFTSWMFINIKCQTGIDITPTALLTNILEEIIRTMQSVACDTDTVNFGNTMLLIWGIILSLTSMFSIVPFLLSGFSGMVVNILGYIIGIIFVYLLFNGNVFGSAFLFIMFMIINRLLLPIIDENDDDEFNYYGSRII